MKNVFGTKEDAAKLEKKLVKRVSAVEGTIDFMVFCFLAYTYYCHGYNF